MTQTPSLAKDEPCLCAKLPKALPTDLGISFKTGVDAKRQDMTPPLAFVLGAAVRPPFLMSSADFLENR